MAIRSLPLEICESIATYLEDDKDLCTYTLICPETHNAVHSRRGTVWRAMYSKTYDLPPGRTGCEVMLQYMKRRMITSRTARKGFLCGHTEDETKCLEVLRDLINESHSGASSKNATRCQSNNLTQLQNFVKASNILDTVRFDVHRSDHKGRLLQTIQLVLTHLQLDLSIRSQVKDFCFSQQIVYTPPNEMPLFLDKKGTVNIGYLLHIVNFFKYHMKTEPENTLYPPLSELEDDCRPSSWAQPLKQGLGIDMLSSSWKGSYAYIPRFDELSSIRERDPSDNYHDMPIPDALDCENGFQSLEIDRLPISNAPWPAVFEERLSAMPSRQLLDVLEQEQSPPSTRRSKRVPRHRQCTTPPPLHASSYLTSTYNGPSTSPKSRSHVKSKTNPQRGKDYLHFSGSGRDLSEFQCTGVIHSLPPQSGIPGWQRVCMMKYSWDPTSSNSSTSSTSSPTQSPTFSGASSPDGDSTKVEPSKNNPFAWGGENSSDDPISINEDCWCYEGILLPGGKIMLGRWWHPLDEDEYSSMGPFIFWNVNDRGTQ